MIVLGRYPTFYVIPVGNTWGSGRTDHGKRNQQTLGPAGRQTNEPGDYGDGGGLYLQVSKWKTKSIFRYSLGGKTRYMGLGSLNAFSLAEARERARAARQLLADGVDPIEQRHSRRAETRSKAAKRMSFADAARQYIATHKASWSERHAEQWRQSLETYAFPVIGDLDVSQAIDTAAVMRTVEPIWHERNVTAHRVRNRIESVLDWASALRLRSGDNPARWKGHLDNLLAARSKIAAPKHLAAMPYSDVPAFVERLRSNAFHAVRLSTLF